MNGRLNVNVALNRPAYQVSTLFHNGIGIPLQASYANDGSHVTHVFNGPCVHTLTAMNPWWAVDLGVPLHVTAVNFTNRDLACSFVIF